MQHHRYPPLQQQEQLTFVVLDASVMSSVERTETEAEEIAVVGAVS